MAKERERSMMDSLGVPKRMQSLWWSFLCTAFGALFVICLYVEAREIIELARYGREANGTVVSYKQEQRYVRRRTRILDIHTITFSGQSKAFDLDKQYPVGTRFRVVYSARSPSIARITQSGKGFFPLLLDQLGWTGLILLPGFTILFGAAGVRYFWDFLKGR